MKYEATIRSVTAFLAALVGFGLLRLLDGSNGDALASYRVPCFLIAVFLFLRFLTGTANHLWTEYVKSADADRSPIFFAMDISFMVLFGVLAALICNAKGGQEFLTLTCLLLTAFIVWGIAVTGITAVVGRATRSNWWPWLTMSIVQFVAFLAAWQSWNSSPSATTLWWLSGLAAICMVVDLTWQLAAVESSTEPTEVDPANMAENEPPHAISQASPASAGSVSRSTDSGQRSDGAPLRRLKPR